MRDRAFSCVNESGNISRAMMNLGFFVVLLTLFFVDAGAQNQSFPKGFALFNRIEFQEYPNFHGGAGSIKFAEYYGPSDYKSRHHFLRVVVMPPKSSIGEYRLIDSDETTMVRRIWSSSLPINRCRESRDGEMWKI